MKALLASPTYGPVDPLCVTAIRIAVMTAGRHGTDWVGDYSPDRVTYGAARNLVARYLDDNPIADGIVWIDSDMIPETASIWKLMATVERDNLDFLSGLYHQRRGMHAPLFYKYVPERDTFTQAYMYEPDCLFKADGCGFGIVWTSLRMLQGIKASANFQPDAGEWFPDRRLGFGKFGEDLGFCRQAMQAGYQLWIDSGITSGHCGEVEIVTRETYLKKQAEAHGGLKRVSEGVG